MSDCELAIPVLDLSWASDADKKKELLTQLHSALFDVGFLYVINHDVEQQVIDNLSNQLPILFGLSIEQKVALSKSNNPHFLGYSGFAEETTLGKQDLREQFDFATELPVVSESRDGYMVDHSAADVEQERDFTKLYWRLRGPNQWPPESSMPGFRRAFTEYHNAVADLSYRFVHLIEEAFQIPYGTFDHFFGREFPQGTASASQRRRSFLPPQHRIKLLKYPPSTVEAGTQGVGAHKDSSGWLTFLYQVSNEPGLEVLSADGEWLPVKPIDGSFVVNFGNAFEAATDGAVKATVHRVLSPGPLSKIRYSIPFFQGLPLDMSVTEVREYVPDHVRRLRRERRPNDKTQSFLDPRWDSLGESQLRKWIRSHRDVGLRWYGEDVVKYYISEE